MRKILAGLAGLMVAGLAAIAVAQNVPIFMNQGATILTVGPGGTLDVQGPMKLGGVTTASALTLVPAAGAANISNITITFRDGAGNVVAGVKNFDWWLSDAASCAGLTAVTASGTVAAAAASGIDLQVYSAKKATRSQTLATGIYVLAITDTVKSPFFVCAQEVHSGRAISSPQLVTGNYG